MKRHWGPLGQEPDKMVSTGDNRDGVGRGAMERLSRRKNSTRRGEDLAQFVGLLGSGGPTAKC